MIAALLDGLALFFLPTHLLAVGALGLALGRGARLPVMLALFALGLLAGSLIIASAVRETPAATALLVIAALAGMLAVLAWTNALLNAVLALATGSAVALNSPPHALTVPAAVAMQVGAAVAAFVMLALIACVAARAEQQWQRIGVRVVGSWIVASAILVLALRLAR